MMACCWWWWWWYNDRGLDKITHIRYTNNRFDSLIIIIIKIVMLLLVIDRCWIKRATRRRMPKVDAVALLFLSHVGIATIIHHDMVLVSSAIT
jgi:hypothetical protein